MQSIQLKILDPRLGSEFELLTPVDTVGPAEWSLVEIHPQVFRHDRGSRQPGEPESSTFSFENPGDEQALHWVLTAEEGSVSGVRIALDGGPPVQLSVSLQPGEALRYEGGPEVHVLDARNRRRGTLPVNGDVFRVATGPHSASLAADLVPAEVAKARLELRPRGRAERMGE